ncbi:hypothetical protein AYO47_02125 [Planctomyces sp. SCGC AG-212-M04]|nr:hypothetical protein AYO47_02125 [Planctomyces sp. SCGC AG-212-M04]
MSDNSTTSSEFPAGLLKWAGHRGGGVKRPFHAGSGRPSGDHVETPVVTRLRAWVDNLIVAPATTPSTVLLVGGPGNGKTDAVQVLIEYLDGRLGADGRLVGEFAKIYSVADGSLAPRQVSLSLASFAEALPAGMPQQLRLVQDASEDPQQQGITRGKLLAMELLHCFRSPSDAIYICCVNRGVLSEALSAAKVDGALTDAVQILDELLESVTSGPKDVSCWPLPSAPRIAAWPMDVESLTAQGSQAHAPVCVSFFGVAVDERRWPATCPAGSKCPFCANRDRLATAEASLALAELLRYFELASGKRWTFRDLFSLISHIVVGHDREYDTRSGPMDPCVWAAEQLKKVQQSAADAVKIKLNLVAKLYQHRLFPLWPSFRGGGAHFKATRELAALRAPELSAALGLMSWLGARRNASDTDIAKLLASTWSDVLDPALATGPTPLIETQKRTCTIQDVEERFSLSVADGLEMVRLQVSELEREVLRELAISDEFLASQAYPRKLAPSARVIQQVIRQFACRLIKRSIGTRRGVCRGLVRLREYRDATLYAEGLRAFRKSLQTLLHDDRNRFNASLATTFGQPVPYRSRDVRLITSKVSVKVIQRGRSDSRPVDPIPYAKLGNYVVPVTMELFSSLADRDCGLRAASLTPAVFALFDTTRSIVTGEISRDPRMLEEEVLIEIGGSRQSFHLEDGQTSVISQGDANAG